MNGLTRNHHATAIVIGTQGFLFVGPSGCGKTESALACLARARAQGLFSAFVGDDQVMISEKYGRIIASVIETIAAQAEMRGAGIVDVPVIATAVMDFAVEPVDPQTAARLPPEGEQYLIEGTGSLPLLRLPFPSAEPLDKLLRLTGAAA